MTKTEAVEIFKYNILPDMIEEEAGRIDKPARRQAWNDFIDGLNRQGDITNTQAATWTHPRGLETWTRAPLDFCR